MSLHCGVWAGAMGKGGVSAQALNRKPGWDEAVRPRLLSRGRWHGLEDGAPVGEAINPIEHQTMEMNIEIGCRAKPWMRVTAPV